MLIKCLNPTNPLPTKTNCVPAKPDPPDLPHDQQQPLHPIVNAPNVQLRPKSFKESFMGNFINVHALDVEDWITVKMVTIDFTNEGKSIPKITFSKEVLDILS